MYTGMEIITLCKTVVCVVKGHKLEKYDKMTCMHRLV